MTEKEYEELKASAKVINSLNVSQFLAKIKAKAIEWKGKLSNGN